MFKEQTKMRCALCSEQMFLILLCVRDLLRYFNGQFRSSGEGRLKENQMYALIVVDDLVPFRLCVKASSMVEMKS